MRFLIHILLLPVRLLRGLYFLLASPFRKGNHVLVNVPGKFSESNKSAFMEMIAGEDTDPMYFEFLSDLHAILEHPGIQKVSFFLNKIEYGLAELDDICSLVQKMKDRGIRVSGYATSGDLKTLYFLSFMDEKYTYSNAEFLCVLPSVESYFVKNLLKKWGVEVENFASGKHKSFAEMFTRDGFSPEARENITKLILSLKSQILETMNKNTGLDWSVLAKPITTVESLKEKGFITGYLDEEEFIENLEYSDYKKPTKETEKKSEYKSISLSSIYFHRNKRNFSLFPARKSKLTILPLKGDIVEGERSEKEMKEGVIAAYPVVSILREIRKDKSIKAVLLEIDSGGGSAFASDLIYHELEKLKKEKKVHAYLKNIAASGGYYIAVGTEKIHSNPYCITGSIGTVMVRPDLKNFYQKLGITKDRIEFYPGREIFSEYGKLSRESRNFLQKEILRVKNLFYSVVSANRNIPVEDLEPKAGGRVFSGKDFLDMRMVDTNTTLIGSILSLQEECGPKPLKWEYISPNYSFKSMAKNFRGVLNFMNNPWDYLKIMNKESKLEYRSFLPKSILEQLINR